MNSLSFRQFILCALLSAFLLWSAGQQAGLFAFGWIALTPLLWALHGAPARQRFWRGWLSGFFIYAFVNWWIAPTIARAAPMIGLSTIPGAILGVVAVILVAAIHGFGVALCALIWNTEHGFIRRNSWLLPIIFALLWTLWDVLRTTGQLSHAWGALAYTQWRDIALLQNASWAGQHGLTFFCAWFAASLALWARVGQPVLWRAPLLLLIALHGWGKFALDISSMSSSATTLRVLIVQTAVPSLRKNQPGREDEPFREALRLSYQNGIRGEYNLIVWPETTVDAVGRSGDQQLQQILNLAREFDTAVLFGARTNPNQKTYLNEAVLAQPDGKLSHSAKIRLVPFGERAPFGDVLPFLQMFSPKPEVTPGEAATPLEINADDPSTRIGTLICFESCFRHPARDLRQSGAQAFFILTNDEWFAGSNAPWEHAAMAAMRAVENGVYVVQSANGGYSFVIDRQGRFVVKSSYNKAQTLVADVPLN